MSLLMAFFFLKRCSLCIKGLLWLSLTIHKKLDIKKNKEIQRIMVPHMVTNATLKFVKGQGIVSIERASYKGHA